MLETFRKYTGLMFVVLILLFVGLVFFGSSQQSLLSGPKVIHAHGRGYTQLEFNRMAVNPARMLRELAGDLFTPRYQAVDPYLRRMGVIAWSRAQLTDDQLSSYLVNRVSLHQAMKEFGVAASTADVEQFLKETVFWENGAFNEDAYNDFTKKSLPKLGMTVKDMNEVISEILALEKLSEVMGAGVDASREAVLASYLANSQKVSYKLVSFPLAQFKEGLEPAEEDIKKHWDENTGKYLSKSQRRLTYILARPDYVALDKEKKARKEKAEAEAGDKKAEAEAEPEKDDTKEGSEEKPEPGDEKQDDAPKDTDLTPEERKAAVLDLGITLDELVDRLDDAEGMGFEDLAKDAGFEVKTTELLEQDQLPAELTGELQNATGTAAELIFKHDLGEEPMHAFSEVSKIGTDQWLLFRLDEVIDPKELGYEEARQEARADLVNRSAVEAMEKAAKENHATVQEALKAGKKFDEIAKELELEPVSHQDLQRPPGNEGGPRQSEFTLCIKTNPDALSEVLTEDREYTLLNKEQKLQRSFFVYLEKREVYENPGLQSLIDRQADQARQQARDLVIDNWLSQRSAKADLRLPTR